MMMLICLVFSGGSHAKVHFTGEKLSYQHFDSYQHFLTREENGTVLSFCSQYGRRLREGAKELFGLSVKKKSFSKKKNEKERRTVLFCLGSEKLHIRLNLMP